LNFGPLSTARFNDCLKLILSPQSPTAEDLANQQFL